MLQTNETTSDGGEEGAADQERRMSGATVSEARLASVLDTAVDGIIVIDEQARILVFNKACERMFGFSVAEVMGQNIKVIMPPEYSEHHDSYVAEYLRTGRRKIIGIGREVAAKHRDGTVFPIELSVGEAHTPEGRQFIGIVRDIRARREAEHRLTQLQANLLRMARVSAMDEMGAAIAHELNQPLTALMLYLQAVERMNARQGISGAFPESAFAIFEKAVREAERAGNIIHRMRSFIEKRDPLRRLVDLNPLVEDAAELALLGHQPGTRVLRSLAQDLPQVQVDPIQIQQVVVNLVRNALDAVRNHPAAVVRITTRRGERSVLLAVEDNGPGVSAEAVPDLFKAFTSSKGSGLGLGLAISKTIAQNHGGDLTVDPGGAGRGACFTLHLPLPSDHEGIQGCG
jgi:two-component system sensor kinase FixL